MMNLSTENSGLTPEYSSTESYLFVMQFEFWFPVGWEKAGLIYWIRIYLSAQCLVNFWSVNLF